MTMLVSDALSSQITSIPQLDTS